MWAVLLLAGCPKRAPDPAVAIAQAIEASDRAWADRAAGGLAPVGAPLVDAWTVHRGHPELGWRVIRWRIAEGDATTDPIAARAAWAIARAEMVTCLDGDGLFAQRRREGGWDAALRRLAPEREACAAWGALGWVRWTESLGPDAAALDLPTLDALLGAVGGGPGAREPADWATGVLLAIRTDGARDPERAVTLLARTVERDPASIRRRVDLWRVGGDERLGAALRTETPRRPEDVGVWTTLFGGADPIDGSRPPGGAEVPTPEPPRP